MEEDCIKGLSPSTELELMKLVTDNCVCAVGYALMSSLVTVAILLSTNNIYLRIMTLPLCAAGVVLFPFAILVNLVISMRLDAGDGDRVGRWCRNKVFAYILMINVFNLISSENRDRTSKLLQRINQEFEDPNV